MQEPEKSNGHRHPEGGHSVNAYVDVATRAQPREIAEFEINTDPYANVLPGVRTTGHSDDDDLVHVSADAGYRSRPSAVVIVVSVFLIVVLLLPLMAQVFARLLH